MGQVHVASVRAIKLPDMVAALGQAGFEIADEPTDGQEKQKYRCRRGDREVILAVSTGREDADEVFVVLAHPPNTMRPWRWGGDHQFFGDVTNVLDDFRYLD